MMQVRKKVFDSFLITRCKRDVCKCIAKLKDKETITIKDSIKYSNCFNCTVNDIQKKEKKQ